MKMFAFYLGSMQSRETTLQILSPATASERSIVNQWTESFGIEKCFNATNGNGTANAACCSHNPNSASADGE
jgi:hypothetical protein